MLRLCFRIEPSSILVQSRPTPPRRRDWSIVGLFAGRRAIFSSRVAPAHSRNDSNSSNRTVVPSPDIGIATTTCRHCLALPTLTLALRPSRKHPDEISNPRVVTRVGDHPRARFGGRDLDVLGGAIVEGALWTGVAPEMVVSGSNWRLLSDQPPRSREGRNVMASGNRRKTHPLQTPRLGSRAMRPFARRHRKRRPRSVTNGPPRRPPGRLRQRRRRGDGGGTSRGLIPRRWSPRRRGRRLGANRPKSR